MLHQKLDDLLKKCGALFGLSMLFAFSIAFNFGIPSWPLLGTGSRTQAQHIWPIIPDNNNSS
jgi:hypothetical protein